MEIILASASPRRRELLTQIGLEFTVIPAKGEEVITSRMPSDVVMELAAAKASEVYESHRMQMAQAKTQEADNADPLLVIGADTIVAYQGTILGKPFDEEDARRILNLLSGHTHEVYTGVSLIYQRGEERQQIRFYEKTRVSMYPITPEEITDYIKSGEPMDKAGAYGIQGLAARFIKRIDGDYNNVVGLPVGSLYQKMRQLGIAISMHTV